MAHFPGYENASQVLEALRNIHERLAQLYCRLRHGAEETRAQMLLERMETREKRMIETLTRYEADAPEKVLSTWLQYPYHRDTDAFMDEIEAAVPLDMNTHEIYQLGSRVDEFIEEMLQHLRKKADYPDLERVFADLQEGERQESIALSKDINSLREL